ncbi:MAG: hypothetical protein ACKVJQ_07515 [Alphaproteobacteria bacterium]|jgi:hypothetical protein
MRGRGPVRLFSTNDGSGAGRNPRRDARFDRVLIFAGFGAGAKTTGAGGAFAAGFGTGIVGGVFTTGGTSAGFIATGDIFAASCPVGFVLGCIGGFAGGGVIARSDFFGAVTGLVIDSRYKAGDGGGFLGAYFFTLTSVKASHVTTPVTRRTSDREVIARELIRLF